MKIFAYLKENGYPVNAAKFFRDYKKYLGRNVDEYGVEIVDEHAFDSFDVVGPDIPKELYEKYLIYREQLREYYKKTGTRKESTNTEIKMPPQRKT